MGSPAADSQAFTPLPRLLTVEEGARADLYALIARLLLQPPDSALLGRLASSIVSAPTSPNPLDGLPGSPLEEAWRKLCAAASAVDADAVVDEYSSLFFDIGSPQVNPYGSRYLAGFMMEKPLARLRSDLLELGLVRKPESGELEDHLGALCETMRVLITGETGHQAALASQRAFFDRHLGPWWRRCLDDVRQARGANFYRCVADVAEAFLDVEEQAFEMAESPEEAGAAHHS